ncbi:MAG: hypothetical protein LBI04_08520 [Treponema sp.]|nr:hypothetical protein [Treponema sp.]
MKKFIREIRRHVTEADKDMPAFVFNTGIPKLGRAPRTEPGLMLTGPPYPVSNG